MTGRIYVCLIAIILTVSIAAAQEPQQDYRKAMNRGAAMERAGNYNDAIVAYREASIIAERDRLGARPHAAALNQLGLAYDHSGRYAEAIRFYRRTLTILEREDGSKKTGDYAAALGNLAAGYGQTGQRKAAEANLREALAIYNSLENQDKSRLAILQTALAETLLHSKKHSEAERLLREALAGFESRPDMKQHQAIALSNLGVVFNYEKRHADAIPMFRKAIGVMEEALGATHPKLVPVLNNLGVALLETRQLADAEEAMQRAVTIAEARYAPDHPSLGNLLINYAAVIRKAGRKDEAKAMEGRGKSVMSAAARNNGIGALVDVKSFR